MLSILYLSKHFFICSLNYITQLVLQFCSFEVIGIAQTWLWTSIEREIRNSIYRMLLNWFSGRVIIDLIDISCLTNRRDNKDVDDAPRLIKRSPSRCNFCNFATLFCMNFKQFLHYVEFLHFARSSNRPSALTQLINSSFVWWNWKIINWKIL